MNITEDTAGLSEFDAAMQLLEKELKEDPEQDLWNGELLPAEWVFAQRLHVLVKELNPGAGEHLILAAYTQHIGRHKTPRTSYPEGRAGYLKWRSQMAIQHAQAAERVLTGAGYNRHFVEKVQNINRKKGLKADADVQCMEDALCLEFLKYRINDFALKHDDEKMLGIISKTWNKMTDRAHQVALTYQYSDRALALIKQALL